MNKYTFIMPSYNSESFLKRSLDAFVNLNYPEKELLIIDDKSEDTSHKIISSYSNKYKNIIWIKEKDSGISDAYNIGLKHATGEFIGYLGSDDLLLPNFLSPTEDILTVLPETDAIYFDSYTYTPDQRNIALRSLSSLIFRKTINRPNLVKYGTIVGLQNILFKKDVIKKYQLDKKNRYSMDYEVMLRMLSNNSYLFVPMSIPMTVNIQSGNISSLLAIPQRKEAKALALKYSASVYERLKIILNF